jgi:hypothetical protein
MKLKKRSSKAVTLLEALIAAIVISVGVVSVFRAFTTTLAAAQLSQHITSANFLFKSELCGLQQRCGTGDGPPFYFQEKTLLRGKEFITNYEITDTDSPRLKKLKYTILWEEKKNSPYSIQFDAYLLCGR